MFLEKSMDSSRKGQPTKERFILHVIQVCVSKIMCTVLFYAWLFFSLYLTDGQPNKKDN